jgi:hypothetical protein
MKVIAFPEYTEVDLLLKKYKIVDSDVEKPLIKEAISAIRRTHGVFEYRLFEPLIQLLEHDWLPSDIPILLPAPTSLCGI